MDKTPEELLAEFAVALREYYALEHQQAAIEDRTDEAAVKMSAALDAYQRAVSAEVADGES